MKPVRASEVSPIEHDFLLGTASDLYARVLVVRFRGRHVRAEDARAMEAVVAYGATLFVPDALIVDLAALELAGGGDLRGIVRAVEPNLEEGFPLFVVPSSANRAEIAGAYSESLVAASVEDAIDRIGRLGPWALR